VAGPAGAKRAPGAAADAQPAGVTLVRLRLPRTRRAVRSLWPSALTTGRAWTIRHNGRRYAVFDSGGELQVSDARCPHNGGPLASGVVRNGTVSCPWHWYCFDLRTGECRTAAGYQLRMYPVLERDGRLFAELPGAVRPRSWRRLVRARKPAAD